MAKKAIWNLLGGFGPFLEGNQCRGREWRKIGLNLQRLPMDGFSSFWCLEWGFWGRGIDFRGQKRDLSTLIGALVASLLWLWGSTCIFSWSMHAYSHIIYQIRGFYSQTIYFQCQIYNLNTLTGALVAELSIIRANLHIFLIKTCI